MHTSRAILSLIILCLFVVSVAQVSTDQQQEILRLEKKLQDSDLKKKVRLFNLLSRKLLPLNVNKSQEYADSAYRLALVLKDSVEQTEALNNLGEAYFFMYQYKEAIHYYSQVYDVAQKTGNDSLLSEVLVNLGITSMNIEAHDDALEYFREATKIQERKGYQHRLAATLFQIGANFHSMSEFFSALDYYNQADVKNDPPNKLLTADILNNKGIIYFDLGSFETALEHYLNSLKIVEELNDKSGIANVLNNIGLVYYESGNLEKALEYYQKSLKIEEEIKNIKGVADSYNNIGIVFSDWDQNELAISYYEKALKIYNDFEGWLGIADVKNNIGESFAMMGEYEIALNYLMESLELEEKYGSEFGMAQSYHAIATVYFKQKDYKKASDYNGRSYKISDSLGLEQVKMTNAELFYNIYSEMGNVNKSLEFYKEFKTLEDSIYTKELRQKIVDLQLKYDIEQKEKDREKSQKEFSEKQASIKRQRVYLVLIFVVMLIFGVLIYLDFRSKSKTTKTLKAINTQLNGQQEKLSKTLDDLLESEAKYKTLVENSPTGILLIDEKGTILEVNQKMLSILGSPGPEETKKINCLEFPPLKKVGLVESIQASIKTGEGISKKTDYCTQWGKNLHLRFTITPIKDKSGKVKHLIINVEDGTRSSHVERLKEESELKYRILVENSLQAMLIVQEGRVIFANSRIEELTGHSVDEVRNAGRRWLNLLIHTDDKRRSYKNVKDALEGKNINAKQHYKIVRKDGDVRIMETLGSVVDFRGNPAMLIVAIDITERTRSRDLLMQSEQRLREVNAMKDKFFSIIAHDLKNPFNSIMGFSSLLHEAYDNYSEKQRKAFIKDICESSENTFKLLQNLLEWSRTQTGAIDFVPKKLNTPKIINEILVFLNTAFQRKNISISTVIPKKTDIYADENMVKLVLRNLLSNALKFTFSGGKVDIVVTVEKINTNIEIKDNGVGIKKEDLSGIFRIDREIKSIGTEGETGSGLGLILCKEFVEMNHGQIEVESTYGEGSIFRISLPNSDIGKQGIKDS